RCPRCLRPRTAARRVGTPYLLLLGAGADGALHGDRARLPAGRPGHFLRKYRARRHDRELVRPAQRGVRSADLDLSRPRGPPRPGLAEAQVARLADPYIRSSALE